MEAFLEAHAKEIERLENGKIKCTVTGHEMKPDLAVLETHWRSKAYKKKSAVLRRATVDLTPYGPYITPHKYEKHLVFCHLTKKKLNIDPAELEAHINGKRYQNALTKQKPRKERPAGFTEVAVGGPDDGVDRIESIINDNGILSESDSEQDEGSDADVGPVELEDYGFQIGKTSTTDTTGVLVQPVDKKKQLATPKKAEKKAGKKTKQPKKVLPILRGVARGVNAGVKVEPTTKKEKKLLKKLHEQQRDKKRAAVESKPMELGGNDTPELDDLVSLAMKNDIKQQTNNKKRKQQVIQPEGGNKQQQRKKKKNTTKKTK